MTDAERLEVEEWLRRPPLSDAPRVYRPVSHLWVKSYTRPDGELLRVRCNRTSPELRHYLLPDDGRRCAFCEGMSMLELEGKP